MRDPSTAQVTVFLDLDGTPLKAGVAYFTLGRQRVTSSFSYDSAYLSRPGSVDLDPSLPRRSGQQYVSGLPGSFQDSAPDRWGRNLIDKRWRVAERESRQRLPGLTPVDYLLGVSDLTRQGDLRYRIDEDGPFLDPGITVPRLVALPRLLAAADQVTRDPDDQSAVQTLLDAGSGSLGGARPKASVLADDGRLLIAKFPRPGDEWDVMAWEKTALDLAERAGIAVPTRRLVTVSGAWRLSPLFDVNPEPDPLRGRVTGIAGAVRPAEEVDGLLALAPHCRLGRDATVEIVRQVVDAVRGWRAAATRNGIAGGEQARFADVLDSRAAELASAMA